jgi:hypothetical protein
MLAACGGTVKARFPNDAVRYRLVVVSRIFDYVPFVTPLGAVR